MAGSSDLAFLRSPTAAAAAAKEVRPDETAAAEKSKEKNVMMKIGLFMGMW